MIKRYFEKLLQTLLENFELRHQVGVISALHQLKYNLITGTFAKRARTVKLEKQLLSRVNVENSFKPRAI